MAFRSFGKRRTSRKSRKSGRKSRRVRKTMDSLVLKRRKIKGRRHSKRRAFGKTIGPGFAGQTSYPNAYARYFKSNVPFVNASNWWYPYAGGKMQSPEMLMKKP
jgi:hypothetical protein